MNQINIQYHQTAIGKLRLGSFNQQLCLVNFSSDNLESKVTCKLRHELEAQFNHQTDNILEQTKIEIDEYFAGTRQKFTIPLLTVGTIFQKNVWNALLQVHYGTTLSYSEQAQAINNAGAARAVGSANGANSIAIIIPCHRIIAADGSLGGYAGGLEIKKFLLQLEREVARGISTP